MKEIVESSREYEKENPRQSPSTTLIIRLESWIRQEKPTRLFSVDWVLKQKHLTRTERSVKLVSHYTHCALLPAYPPAD